MISLLIIIGNLMGLVGILLMEPGSCLLIGSGGYPAKLPSWEGPLKKLPFG